MKCEQVLHLDVTNVNTYQYVYAKQGDKNSRMLKVLLFNQGARVLPAVTDQITLRCIKPDQKSCMITGSVDDTGIISVELTDQCLAVPGSVRADITVQNGESVISSVTFFIQVSPMPLNSNQATSTNEFLSLIETLEAAKSATDLATKAAQQAQKTAQSVRDDADAGKFNGVQGPQGEQGPMGATGPQGPKGDKGDTGKDAVIDTTLTHAGQAADAAVVGNRLSALSEEMLTEESDPTVPAWAKEAQKPSYTASEVGADPSGTAVAQVTAHNTSEAAHNDIRLLIQGLTGRLNALADSDDTTLDQLSEVVAYIKSNRSLIEAITTSKVSVADIVDNLTANVSNKPLSAAQGVVIKTLIDALRNEKLDVPTGEGQTGDVPVMQADGSTKWGKTGLDVSGAKVGQTVEITAVDAEGKPTAWKAVEYMTKANPTGTGAFSMGRKAGSTVGECSHAEGYRTTASGDYSHAEGNYTTALGIQSHAEGSDTKANRQASHAEGFSTIASSDSQHVQGKYNIEDADGKYAHIVGNGTSSSARSNAHTLDWSGNAWYAGTVEGTAVIVKSSTEGSTKRFKITVDDSGTISATEV